MSKKWVIDFETSTVLPGEVVDDTSLEFFCRVCVPHGNGSREIIKLKENVFPTERGALLRLRERLNENLLKVQYKINSLDKIEE